MPLNGEPKKVQFVATVVGDTTQPSQVVHPKCGA
jgi:hypothetical protein